MRTGSPQSLEHRDWLKGDLFEEPHEFARRRFLKGAIIGLGAATIGVASSTQVAAVTVPTVASRLDGTLRSITWTGSNSAIGLFGIGLSEVRVRPLVLQGKQLQFSGNDLATLTVGPGPVAIGQVPSAAGSVLVVRTTLETIGQYSVSFALKPNVRRFLLDEGIGFDGYQTAGSATYNIQQVVSAPILLSSNGELESPLENASPWKDLLTDAHYQPLSVHSLAGKWIVVLASSGSSNVDVSTLGNIIGVELSTEDASIVALHSIGRVNDHLNKDFKVVELTETRIAVLAAVDSGIIHVIDYDVATQKTTNTAVSSSAFPNSRQILQHDRVTASGRTNSWIAEVLPGTYVLETMGSDVL